MPPEESFERTEKPRRADLGSLTITQKISRDFRRGTLAAQVTNPCARYPVEFCQLIACDIQCANLTSATNRPKVFMREGISHVDFFVESFGPGPMKKYILATFFAALSGVPSRNSFLLSNF